MRRLERPATAISGMRKTKQKIRTLAVNVHGSITYTERSVRTCVPPVTKVLTRFPVGIGEIPITDVYSHRSRRLQLCIVSVAVLCDVEALTAPDQSFAPKMKGFTLK